VHHTPSYFKSAARRACSCPGNHSVALPGSKRGSLAAGRTCSRQLHGYDTGLSVPVFTSRTCLKRACTTPPTEPQLALEIVRWTHGCPKGSMPIAQPRTQHLGFSAERTLPTPQIQTSAAIWKTNIRRAVAMQPHPSSTWARVMMSQQAKQAHVRQVGASMCELVRGQALAGRRSYHVLRCVCTRMEYRISLPSLNPLISFGSSAR